MSAAAISTLRSLLLTVVLMLLVQETFPYPASMLTPTTTNAPLHSHRRRHQPDSRFHKMLRGNDQKLIMSDEPVMMADDATGLKRSISGGHTVEHVKTITNKNSMTLFWERNEDGTPIIRASNKTPNASSRFTIKTLCTEESMRRFSGGGCRVVHNEDHEDGKIFKVITETNEEYIMCIKRKRLTLNKISSITTMKQVRACLWEFDDVHEQEDNAQLIYVKDKKRCPKKKKVPTATLR